MDNENTYFDLVYKLAIHKIDAKINNESIEHARDITIAMLVSAKTSINMFSGELNNELFSNKNFLDGLDVFFKMRDINANINIIVQNISKEDLKEHAFFKKVFDSNYKNQCKFYIANDGTDAKKEQEHFQTVDETGYRLEVDTSNIKAEANFYDKEKTLSLNKKFNKFISSQATLVE